MSFIIEPVTDADMAKAVDAIREEVFGREHRLHVLVLRRCPAADMLTLLARTEPGHEPVGTMTVVNTTGDAALHAQMGLRFPEHARVARYAQMAVLPRYRGMNVPLRLMLEARRRFIVPQKIEYTWFVFDAARAKSSCFTKLLGFKAGRAFQTEYGCSRVLMRQEPGPVSARPVGLEAHSGVQPVTTIPLSTANAATAS